MRLALVSALVSFTLMPSAAGATVEPIEVVGAGEHLLIVIEDPVIEGDSYAVTGTVSYTDVGGEAYLEMWSYFDDGSSFFSRTLAEDGLPAVIMGTSGDRSFSIPFFLGDSAAVPVRLEVNVVLPGSGRVRVSDLQLESPIGAGGVTGGWWGMRMGGLMGAILGSTVGLMGAALGVVTGRGLAPRFAASIPRIGIGFGVSLAFAGLIALAVDQPRHVWYPLLLVGVITAGVMAFILPVIRRRQQQVELHRMHALDA